MELLKLLGILIVVIGFVLKLDSILIIMIAAIVTALVAGMDPVTFLETLGSSFVANRSMCVFVMVMVVTGTLERNGLKQAAANLMKKFKNASAGVVLAIYGVFRLVFAAFNVSFGALPDLFVLLYCLWRVLQLRKMVKRSVKSMKKT